MSGTIWKFETENFTVRMDWEYDQDTVDLSWDETGETAEKLEDGEWAVYTFIARVIENATGNEIGVDYLGASIHADPDDFRDHVGLAAKSRRDFGEGRSGYGSYFMDMIGRAIEEARETYAKPRPKLREVA
jgi:hypothetical protein